MEKEIVLLEAINGFENAHTQLRWAVIESLRAHLIHNGVCPTLLIVEFPSGRFELEPNNSDTYSFVKQSVLDMKSALSGLSFCATLIVFDGS